MALGVGPSPQGVIPEDVGEILAEIGKWLETNGDAIYDTRPTENYRQEDIWFTASKDGSTLYGIYTPKAEMESESEKTKAIQWEGNIPLDGYVTILDGNKKVKVRTEAGKTILKLAQNSSMPVAFKFRYK